MAKPHLSSGARASAASRPATPVQSRWVLAAGAACLMAAGALLGPSARAQSAEELVRAAEARVKAATPGYAGWVRALKFREDEYRTEAEELQAANVGRIKQGFAYLDDSMWRSAARDLQGITESDDGVVYVAVSLTMPPNSLRALARDAHKAGVKVVIRGLVDGSFQKTMVAARAAFAENSSGGVAIDPQVFRAFDVDRVPTFIAATSPVLPCEGLDCESAPTPNDRVAGNVSLAEALRLLATEGSEAPAAARQALERLRG